jgi:hypothetical protein
MEMIEITNGERSLEVTEKVYRVVYKDRGFRPVDEDPIDEEPTHGEGDPGIKVITEKPKRGSRTKAGGSK